MSCKLMASRLIIWILLTMMSLQGAFAASPFHCPVSSQNVRNSHFSSAFPARKSANPDFGKAQPPALASPDAGHHHDLSPIPASGINHHAESHDVHHHHKMPCCDSAGGGVPSLSFLLPAGIKLPVSVERPHKPLKIFLDGPKRPPRLFHI